VSAQLAIVISSVYWSLISCFPHLIAPATAKLIPPLTIDLALHASPLFTLLVDFFVFESKFSKTYVHKAAPAAVVVYAIWYASFVEYCATFNGSFPYPFLTHNPFPVRVLIYAAAAGIALSCFRTLNALHA
ncbi:FAR-17a/AIG1-like protein, partial [Boletus coccyginus]